MRLFRKKNISKIIGAIELDEYDDALQDDSIGQEDFLPEVDSFLILFVRGDKVLEIGCGSGNSLGRYGITHGIEPCSKRFLRASQKFKNVKRNVVECIEFKDKFFDSALMINGFFQVRSDYEALIEVNRVLKIGGVFIFNLLINDDIDVVLGRCYGSNNYVRLVEQFGFMLIGRKKYNAGNRFYPPHQVSEILAFEKASDFDNRFLNLLQAPNVKALKNFVLERDWRLI